MVLTVEMSLLDAHSSNQENQGEESLDIFGLCCEVVDLNLHGGRESAQPGDEAHDFFLGLNIGRDDND